MATVVTVPGANHTVITETYTTGSANAAAAQNIANILAVAQANNTLFVQNYDQSPGTVPTGDVGELAVTTPGGANIPSIAGYTYVAIDQSVTGAVTISGSYSLFAGNQTIDYTASGSGLVTISAGDGNNTINLPTGTNYSVTGGSGADTYNANGSGTITGGTGSNTFFVGGDGTSNLIFSNGTDTIAAGAGSSTIDASSGTGTQVLYGGSGSLEYIGGAGSATISGGTGTETLFGGSGQNLTYLGGSNTTPYADVIAAGGGNETLNAGGASVGAAIAAGSGSDSIIGTTGNDIFFGGTGSATITGNGGADSFIYGSNSAGGTDIITDFSSSDNFVLVGYGANAAQNALNAATVAGGNATVQLSDNTTITFLNVTDTSTIHNQSF